MQPAFSMRGFCRPYRTLILNSTHPALKRWAILFRPAERDCDTARSFFLASFNILPSPLEPQIPRLRSG